VWGGVYNRVARVVVVGGGRGLGGKTLLKEGFLSIVIKEIYFFGIGM